MKRLLSILLFLSTPLLAQIPPGVLSGAVNKVTPTGITTKFIDNAVVGSGNNQNTYVGSGWSGQALKSTSYAGTFIYSNVLDDYVETDFVGNGVKLIAEKYPTHGIVAVSIDGGSETNIDLYSSTVVEWASDPTGATVYTSPTLTNGPHTIKVRITHTKNASSTDYYGVIDAFQVSSNSSTPPPVTPTGDWFVGYTGASDSNTGTGSGSGQSFATIQKAATVAQAGDVVTINSGTYRETITPTNQGTSTNPITYQACAGCTVVISGAEPVNTTWTVHSGNIYKTTIDLGEPLFDEYMTGFSNTSFDYNNTEILAQQIFQAGDMQNLAQYPNATDTESLLTRGQLRGINQTTSFTINQINDAPLSGLALTGAYVWVNGWFLTYTRTISSHSGTTINFANTDGDVTHFSKFYKVFGKLSLLDAEKEWFWDDPTNTLYLRQTGGGSPTGVEYKERNWGFDLRSKAYINIRGLQFFACEPVMTDGASTATIIDNIRVKYQNHSVLETRGGAGGYHDSAVQTGMKIRGAGSVVKNSEFRYGAGMGIWASSGTTIQNNYFYNYSYAGQYSAPIKPTWGAGNITIDHNSFSRTGRGHIELTPETTPNNQNLTISYNDFGPFLMLQSDGGAIYGSRVINLTGTRIHHNWFHNDGAYNEAGVGKQEGTNANALYLDQASGPVTFDHNVSWNGMSNGPDVYTDTQYTGPEGSRTLSPANLVYNNTHASINSSYSGVSGSYKCKNTTPSDVERNNIYLQTRIVGPGLNDPGNVANTVLSGTNPLFVGGNRVSDTYTAVTNPEAYFQVQSGSTARGKGTALAGFNDDDTPPYEAGAYYYLQPAWTAGYVAVTYVPTP